MNISKDLVAASATPLVLAILSEGESYGYAILKRVSELSKNELEWTDGMLYPLLHRLERNGWVEASWGESDTGRRRKYYRLTPAGRDELAHQQRQWRVVDSALRGIWLAALDLTVWSVDAPKEREDNWRRISPWKIELGNGGLTFVVGR